MVLAMVSGETYNSEPEQTSYGNSEEEAATEKRHVTKEPQTP